jgi:alkanesulfonate monooxygenase SsuD/methylene tetrahydromethanopterin reductase-like flavin-dependent oxidoreductase (luciferase family)
MRVGVLILPALRWRTAERLWRFAEDVGFDAAWTYDHLAWRDMRDGPWFSALPVLTAAATATRRIRLGTLVSSPNYRHPVTLAKEAMTVDDVSGGRLTLGIGAGSISHDAVMLGQAPLSDADRAARLEEFTAHLDVLLRQRETPRLDGRFFAARDARANPGCVQEPRLPLAIAAAGPRGQRLAARLAEAWITLGHPRWPDDLTPAERWATLARQVASLERACEAEGRDPATLQRIYLSAPNRDHWWASPDAFGDLEARLAELGFAEVVVHYPHPGSPFALDGEQRFAEVMTEVLAGR